MFETSDIQSSVERMKQHMELRGLRPNTVSRFVVPEESGKTRQQTSLWHLRSRARCP
jgi:hypothetical protein